jgi:hypothetical protein
MLCLACGAEMSLVQVVKDTTMFVPGYEHHTWQCSGCSTVERRMTFTREKTPTQTVPVEPTQTMPAEPIQTGPVEPIQAPVEPIQAAPVEPTQTGPVKATQIVPGEPTQTVPPEPIQTVSVEPIEEVPVEPTQTAPVKPTHPEPPAAMFQSSAWAKALEKLRSFKERATETERHTQFSRDWDNLRSVPPPSASSEMKPDEPLRSPTEPIASPAPTEHDEPIAPESKPERARRLR